MTARKQPSSKNTGATVIYLQAILTTVRSSNSVARQQCHKVKHNMITQTYNISSFCIIKSLTCAHLVQCHFLPAFPFTLLIRSQLWKFQIEIMWLWDAATIEMHVSCQVPKLQSCDCGEAVMTITSNINCKFQHYFFFNCKWPLNEQ